MKTVLITGCSSGYGLETARYFHEQGWKVIATMRTPREDVLPRSERLRVLALDITNPKSIAVAVDAAGPIDVLVLLCHKRSLAFTRRQHGQRGNVLSNAAAISSRKVVMDDGTWRCVRWAAARLVMRG